MRPDWNSRFMAKSIESGSKTQSPNPGTSGSAQSSFEPGNRDSGHRWTFLTNHSHVLILLARNPDMILRDVANQIGITERAVQRITQELEEGGFIEREKVGRKNHYRILTNVPLRHPIESHKKIGDLLDLIING